MAPAAMCPYWLVFYAADSVYEAGLLRRDRVTQPNPLFLGPFTARLALTYEYIHVGPDADPVAAWDSTYGVWRVSVDPEIRGALSIVEEAHAGGMIYTDVQVSTIPPASVDTPPRPGLAVSDARPRGAGVLALSITHLTSASRLNLLRVARDQPPYLSGRWPTVIEFSGSLVVNVPQELADRDVPEDLARVLEHARSQAASWVLLTTTAAQHPDLPTYPRQ